MLSAVHQLIFQLSSLPSKIRWQKMRYYKLIYQNPDKKCIGGRDPHKNQNMKF